MNTMLARICLSLAFVVSTHAVSADEVFPKDKRAGSIGSYFPAPQYRETESHPLRYIAYALHPIGWLMKEVVVRPISYVFSGSEVLSGVFGYEEKYGIERESCLVKDIGNCREIPPYGSPKKQEVVAAVVEAPVLGDASSNEIFFPNVNFDFNARVLNDSGKAKAKEVAALLESKGAVKVSLEGHTDDRGSDAYNNKLGIDRAEAVKAELIALGVAAEKLSTVSFGESKPVIAEKTDYARSMNRRVEVKITE